MYIKFTDDLNPYKGKIITTSKNVAQVILEEEIAPNASGFRVYRDYEMTKLLGNYLDFTTLYDAENFILSNDGSVKVAEENPAQEEPIEETSQEDVKIEELATRVSDLENAIMELTTMMTSESGV